MKKEIELNINGKIYNALIEYKFIKHIICKYSFGKLNISAPIGTMKFKIENFLSKCKIDEKVNLESPICNDYVFIFGEKFLVNNYILETPYFKILFNQDEFYNLSKKFFYSYCFERLNYYSRLMNIKNNYKLRINFTKTRYGSNSIRTKTISINSYLIHFPKEIIDSVIVHELAHDIERNHSSKFYDIIYMYCPNYNLLDRKLKSNFFKI